MLSHSGGSRRPSPHTSSSQRALQREVVKANASSTSLDSGSEEDTSSPSAHASLPGRVRGPVVVSNGQNIQNDPRRRAPVPTFNEQRPETPLSQSTGAKTAQPLPSKTGSASSPKPPPPAGPRPTDLRPTPLTTVLAPVSEEATSKELTFYAPDTEANVILDENGQLKAASFSKLVEKLTAASSIGTQP